MARAFLVIDIQNDYFAGGALLLWQAEETEARLIAAIGRARAAGDRIILVRHVSTAAAGPFAAGSAGVEIRPGILDAAGDAPVVTKQVPDAFQDTDLASHLRGVDELLVGGMMTQNCVVFTALSRAADQFRVQVVSDLCTAPTEIVHQVALNALGSKIDVATAAEVWG
ncbi:isochorismatase family protein [Rhodopseudomonas sp. HC1]|uniref:cysteine hydrolase family protein n=1 Tax=Rhodopseudomonas infernalis TaxID=2897386 RepID=UPI001EE839F3|nr:isochorismatase family protein [Rhodopseudomonas infernalis]MCG6204070.1 isochorismatase family protein [Rhodopseudomonas infernalis]